MSRLTQYIKDTRSELKHVNWPNRRQTIFYTIICIVLSFLIAYYMGLFDFIFILGLESLLGF